MPGSERTRPAHTHPHLQGGQRHQAQVVGPDLLKVMPWARAQPVLDWRWCPLVFFASDLSNYWLSSMEIAFGDSFQINREVQNVI
mmetsp:Transcript_15267/g.53671  ORF Transcript_15267/g.53671 Transcript_15267/m.53671 type:complete len:85 (-) Transcript_15267:280-534(-)